MTTRDPAAPLRVAHVITTLVSGGTERMLERIVRATRAHGVEHVVITLADGGEVADALRAADITVHSLGMRRTGTMPDVGAVWRLASLLRDVRPSLVQAWMYHANLLAAVASPLAGTGRAVWGIRAASLPAGRERRRTIALARASARVAGVLARAVIVNGTRANRTHVEAGYPAARMIVIPNGFDTRLWRPDAAARDSVREELGLAPDALLVGMVANFRPIKDHRTLFRAIAAVRRTGIEAHLLLAGVDSAFGTPELARMILEELGPEPGVSALGSRADVPRLTAALDVATLTSIDESFPNVVAEAMACGVPVVSTDAGDVIDILGASDDVVPVGDHDALARRIGRWLSQPHAARRAHGATLRSRVTSRYDLEVVARQFIDTWSRLARG